MPLNDSQLRYRKKNREEILRRRRARYQETKELLSIKHKQYRDSNYKELWFKRVKSRAEKNRIEFNLDISDFDIPKFCPALGIEITINDPNKMNSPSIDRINPLLGYVKGNVRVISYRANQIKSNSFVEEMEKVLNYYKKVSQ